ncbi:MAG TPA: hypothetical protein VMH77_08310 [Steroidobacteraceae bacterium]|nr:hypothetical protein [Steroidobacteraceae bacterium]
MKLLLAILSATTVASAASAWYCAQLLQQERAHHAALIVPAKAPAPARHLAAARPDPHPALRSGTGSDAGADAGGRDAQQEAVARYHLDQLHDPAARAAWKQSIALTLREDWQSMAPHLNLSAAELDQVIAELAEQKLQFERREARCRLDPACDDEALDFLTAQEKAQDERIGALLGPARYASYKAYQESSQERSTVRYLNLQLPRADALSDATADSLVQALGEQRRQFFRDASSRGEEMHSEGDFLAFGSAAITGAADESAQLRESATAYVKREIELASGILSPAQLAIFRDLLEYRLFSYTDQLQNAEVAHAAREAAGYKR